MNLNELKVQLGASKPWPFHLLKQNSAMNGLVQATEPQAAEILADAVDGKHRLAGKIKDALTAMTEPAKIDRLCCIWAKKRQPWLVTMITANKWTGQTEGVSFLCALKSGRQSMLGTDSRTAGTVLQYVTDKDSEIVAGVVEYAKRLPNEPAANDAIYAALVTTRAMEVARVVKEQKRLPSVLNEKTAWWILKCGLQSGLGTDPKTTGMVLGNVTDKDTEVRAAVVEYARRLPNDAKTNNALYTVLVGTRSEDLARVAKEQGRLPSVLAAQTAWWVLKLGFQSRMGTDLQSAGVVLGHFTDKDSEIVAGVVEYAKRLPNEPATNDAIYKVLVETRSSELARMVWEQKRLPSVLNEQTGWWILKCGLQSGLGSDPQTIGIVFGYVTDQDAEVKRGAVEYVGRMPVEARANDAIYGLWIRTQSPEIEKVITNQNRLSSSDAKETLLRLAVGDVDGYLTLDDESGQIFREAWGIAPDALRQRMVQTVTSSGKSRLIDAYTRAVGARDGLDVKTVIKARDLAGDADGLFDATQPLGVLDLLDLCARWAETGNLPKDPERRSAAERAVAAWREVGKIEFEQAPALPEGLVDFFDAEMEGDLGSPDPFLRLHAAIKGKGSPDVKKLMASEHWPDRLAARLIAPELAVSGTQEHVQWTSLAGGVLSNSLFSTTAKGNPTENGMLDSLRKAHTGRNDRVSVINRGLAGVVLAFQSYFLRGILGPSEADDSAEKREAIQTVGAASKEDLEF